MSCNDIYQAIDKFLLKSFEDPGKLTKELKKVADMFDRLDYYRTEEKEDIATYSQRVQDWQYFLAYRRILIDYGCWNYNTNQPLPL